MKAERGEEAQKKSWKRAEVGPGGLRKEAVSGGNRRMHGDSANADVEAGASYPERSSEDH